MGDVRQNCYFYIDEAVPIDEQVMSCMCVSCHDKNPLGWFWEGSKHGYGPYDLDCDICGSCIHRCEQKAGS